MDTLIPLFTEIHSNRSSCHLSPMINLTAYFNWTWLIVWPLEFTARDLWNRLLGDRRDGRHRILRPQIGRNRELSGDCCSLSRDHWFELAHPSTWSVMTPACLMHGFTCLKTFLAKQDGVQQLWPQRLSPTRSHGDFNFEELLSDLNTIARMIRPLLWVTLLYPASWGAMRAQQDWSLKLAAKGVLRARRLCCLRRTKAFSPESAAGSPEAGSYRSPSVW